MKLLCVDPACVEEFWPHVAPLIESALKRSGNFSEVRSDLMGGFALLWIVWADAIKAVVVTQLTEKNGSKFCTIVACAGHGFSDWKHLYLQLEAYAKAEGCKAMRIYGRLGWKRMLDGYRVRSVTLEKVL